VKYVGDDACARCHADIMDSYRQHPMGRSLARIEEASPIERYDAAASNPFVRHGLEYRAERDGDRLVHRETRKDRQGRVAWEVASEVHYAIGSGSHGRSYLIVQDGLVYQSPITWYPQKNRWDLSPGYETAPWHFDRPVDARCLFCHTNAVAQVEHTLNRFQEPIFRGESIGCERCHGPGEIHAQRREINNGMDITIVNPKHLSPLLREAVCEQCHLEGERRVWRHGRDVFDYRPGLPLHEFISTFVKPAGPNDHAFVGQVEQMHASRCFQASAGKLGCISCHDPHAAPGADEKVAFYRARCLKCHQEADCDLPIATRRQKSAQDDCTQCHMPRTGSEIRHTAISDHTVPRKPGERHRPASPPMVSAQPLRHFHDQHLDSADPEVSRDFAIALMDMAWDATVGTEHRGGDAERRAAVIALPLLEAATQRDWHDIAAWESMGTALWLLQRDAQAAEAYARALQRAPHHEMALERAARLANERQRHAEAAEYWQRLVECNPLDSRSQHGLALSLVQIGQPARALEHCREALRLHPGSMEARKLLVACYLDLGDRDRARLELDQLLNLDPPDKRELQRWFEERTRR
jgi:hypothetical protein